MHSFWSGGCAHSAHGQWDAGSKGSPCVPAEVKSRHPTGWTSPSSHHFHPHWASSQFHHIPLDFPELLFSLVLSLVEQETSCDFLSPREAEGNERSGQKGQRAPQPSFCIWAITPSTKHGILPWNFSCPGMGTASAGIPRPTAERKGGSSTLDLFPS